MNISLLQLALVSLGSLLNGWLTALNIQLIPSLLTYHELPPFFYGAILAAPSLLNILLLPWVNSLSDRLANRKLFILGGALSLAACQAVLGFNFTNLSMGVPALLVMFTVMVFFYGPFQVHISEQTKNKGLMAMFDGVSHTLGIILSFLMQSQVLGEGDGYKTAFIISAVATAIIAAISVTAGKDNVQYDRRRISDRRRKQLTVEVERRNGGERRRFGLGYFQNFYLATIVLFMGFSALLSYTYYHFFHVLKFSEVHISVSYICMVAGTVLGTAVLNLINLNKIKLIRNCLLLLIPFIIIFAFITTPTYLSIFMFFMGLPAGGAMTIPMGYLTSEVPERSQAKALARYLQCISIGMMTGAFLGGVVVQAAHSLFRFKDFFIFQYFPELFEIVALTLAEFDTLPIFIIVPVLFALAAVFAHRQYRSKKSEYVVWDRPQFQTQQKARTRKKQKTAV